MMFPKVRLSNGLRLLIPILVLLSTIPMGAQVEYGDFKFNLNGNLGYGYSGEFGTPDSSHGQNLLGDGFLTGSYYDPNFMSFSVRPYYNRTQGNGVSQVISHDNGFDSNVDFFRGSHFPGSVAFNKEYSSTGQTGLPGVAGLVTDGSGQSFQVSWSELLPGLPPVFVSFLDQDSTYNAIGSTGENHNSSKLFTLNSNYQIAGFKFTGNITHTGQTFDYSNYLGVANLSGGGDSTNYGVTAQHALPLNGNVNLGWNHSTYGDDSILGTRQSSTGYGVGLGFIPWTRLQISSNFTYTTNATAALGQALISEGALPLFTGFQNSRSIDFASRATLYLVHGLSITGYASENSASFLGRDYSYTQYGGTLNYRYSQRLLGMLFFSLGVVDNADKQGNSNLGLVGNVGLDRRIGKWETSADFGYSQDVQTISGFDATSTVSYGGSIRRKINEETYWGGTVRAIHSALVHIQGDSSRSEAYTTSLSWKRYGAATTYTKSRGASVITPYGVLNPTPIAPLITDNFIFSNARSFGVSGSAVFLKRIRIGGNYVSVHSTTESLLANAINQAEIYNLRTEYRVRKLSFIGGFTRIDQGMNTSRNNLPTIVNSFYLSISRWFNVF